MKNAIYLLLIFTLTFVNCSKEEIPNIEIDEPKDTTPDEPIDLLELFYETKTFGFRVKDTTKLDLISLFRIDEDISFLTGRRDENLWIAKFNNESKEQLFEFIDSEKLNINQNIYVGYGEYRDITISKIQLIQHIEKDDHIIINTRLLGKDDYIALVIFNKESANHKHIYNNSNLFFQDWYNESYITNTATSLSTIFDKSGNIILKDIENYGFPNVEMAVSYTDYIWIGFMYPLNDTQPSIIRTWLGKHAMNTYKWSKWLSILKEKDAKYEYKIKNKNDNIWIFTFDVLEFFGERHSHELKINIETGNIISLD